MGLSLRDLQEALYHLLGSVLSVSAINRVTIEAQNHMDNHRHSPLVQTPPILIVDGVWVDIQYTSEETKVDRAGHLRQLRQAQERVVLTALAVWPNGTYEPTFRPFICHNQNKHRLNITSSTLEPQTLGNAVFSDDYH